MKKYIIAAAVLLGSSSAAFAAAHEAATLSVSAAAASGYITLLALDDRLKVLKATLVQRGEALRIARDAVDNRVDLDELAAACDLIVLSGGVSVGTYDVARIVLGDAGEGTFRHVRMQPGKPQGHATWGGVPVLAFPGNPLSAAVSWQLFGRAVLSALMGSAAPAWGTAVAGSAWSSPPGRRQLVPVVTATDDAGRLVATPSHQRGSASHMVTALARAAAQFAVPADGTADDDTSGDGAASAGAPADEDTDETEEQGR